MTFYEIEFPLAGLNLSEVENALEDSGAISVTFTDLQDAPILEPKPGEFRLWGDTLMRALFQDSEKAAMGAVPEALVVLSRLAGTLGAHIVNTARITRVQNQDWERVWLKDWKSTRFGRRLWVCPRAAAAPADPNAIVVRLDPGLAFGTGTHPTTALCLESLDSLPVVGRSVIDYGCGSGILGLAALKLGAANVLAVDLDPQALLATRENAILNGVSGGLTVQDTERKLQPAFLVIANILAAPLIELAPLLSAACEPDGWLLLSGLLTAQAGAVKAAYTPAFDRVRIIERLEWCCLLARRVA